MPKVQPPPSRTTAGARILSTLGLLVGLGCSAGCGTQGNVQTVSPPAAMTTVTLLATSTANDQLTAFDLGLTSLTLTSQSGKTVSVLSASRGVEFVHLNGVAEPLLTLSIPRDTYTSATATVGGAQFTCVALDATGGLDTSTDSYGATPSGQVTVDLPSPLTISDTPTGLVLNLQVSKSATYGSCVTTDIPSYSINPTFSLTTAALPTQGAVNTGTLTGIVSSVNASTGELGIIDSDGVSFIVGTSSSTRFQGVSGVSTLGSGLAVDFDAATQPDGSLAATRVEVLDPDATDLSLVIGPITFLSSAQPVLGAVGQLDQGLLYAGKEVVGAQYFSFGGAAFQTAGPLTNLGSLPFTPVVSAATIVPGQRIAMTSHATNPSGGPTYTPLSTITLLPQTLNGSVTAVSSAGQFQVYTLRLAPYELTAALAVQAGQSSPVSQPDIVTVYVDGTAQQQGIGPVTPATLLRVSGLLFNDGGALRMDAISLAPGVPE